MVFGFARKIYIDLLEKEVIKRLESITEIGNQNVSIKVGYYDELFEELKNERSNQQSTE